MLRRTSLSGIQRFLTIVVVLSLVIGQIPSSVLAVSPFSLEQPSLEEITPSVGFSSGYEVALLPGKAAGVQAVRGPISLTFPSDASEDGVFISIHSGSRLADRPLPGGLDTYYAFTLDGSIIGQGGVRVVTLDKPFSLSLSPDNLRLPKGLKLFRWNNAIPNWEEISPSLSAQTNLLTDYAVGGPPDSAPVRSLSVTTPKSPNTEAARTLLSGSNGKAPYLAGYLGDTTGNCNGLSATEVVTGSWRPANVGYLTERPVQLLKSTNGTFYSLGDDGYLRRSLDRASWTKLREDPAPVYYMAQIAANGSTVYAAMDTDSNHTGYSGFYKSTDQGSYWTQVWLPPVPSGADNQHFKGKSVTLSAADNNYLWFVGLADFITPIKYKAWLSADGGNTWTAKEAATGATRIQQVIPDAVNVNRAFMIKADGVYRTTDYGANFTRTLSTTVSMASLENFAQDPGNVQHIWFASGDDGLWESTNAGQSWTHQRVLPQGVTTGQVSVVSFGSDRSVFAGVDQASSGQVLSVNLLKSTYDSGSQTWSAWEDISGDMNTSGPLNDGYGPMRVRAIIPEINAPDEGAKFGPQPDTLIYSDGTTAQAGDYFDAIQSAPSVNPARAQSAPNSNYPNGVNTTSGNYFYHRDDFFANGRGPALSLSRYYNSKDPTVGPFGKGWSFNYGMHVTEYTNEMVMIDTPSSRHIRFVKMNDGSYMASPAAQATFLKNPNHEYGYQLTFKDGTTIYKFNTDGQLTSIIDNNQNEMHFTYDGSDHLTTVEDAVGRVLSFTYTNNHITRANAPLGRTMLFTYTGDLLTSFQNMAGEVTSYGYDANGYLSTITDALDHTQVTSTYDEDGRVLSQEDAESNETTFDYTMDGNTITNPRGAHHDYVFDPSYATIEADDAYYDPSYPNSHRDLYSWDQNCGLRYHTDRNNNCTRLSWDNMNNLTGVYDAEHDSHNFTYNTNNAPINERWTLLDDDPKNLVPNGSFEEDGNGDGVPLDGWIGVVTSGSPQIIWSIYYQRYGTNALLIWAGSNAETWVRPTQQVAVTGATSYALSYDVMTVNLVPARTTIPTGKCIISEFDANHNWVRDQDLFTNLSGTLAWNRKAAVFTTNGSTRFVEIRPVLAYGGQASGQVLFDGILLEQGSAASKYYSRYGYGYGGAGNVNSATNTQDKTTSFGHNTNGTLNNVTDPMSSAIDIDYDPDGNPDTITDGDGKIWLRDYDNAGRKISETDPLNNTTTYEYDDEDRLLKETDPQGHETKYQYDAVGNTLVITDAMNNVTTNTYDAKDNVETVTDAEGNTTTYDYDEVGNQTSVTDALNHTTGSAYDLENQPTSVTTPLGNTTQYQYDAVGNTEVITDANGAVTNMEYDKVNRLTQKSYQCGTSVSYTYNARGLRKSMTDSTGATKYTYDTENRPLTVKTNAGTPAEDLITYAYDDSGRLTDITYPDSKHIDYNYNHRNLLTKVTDWASRETNYTYDNASRLSTAAYPNGTTTTYSYNTAARITEIKVVDGSNSTLNDIHYKMDAVGNRTVITDTAGGTTLVKNFGYDDDYRLISADYGEGTTESFQYDAVGNRTVLTDTGGTISYTYDDDNRMTAAGTITYTWDNNGNMKSKTDGGVTTEYNYSCGCCGDQLTEIISGSDTYTYTYNGDGLRMSAGRNGTVTDYTWDTRGDVPVVISDGTNTYLYGLDRILGAASGQVTYYYQDALGSTRSLANSSGSVTGRYDYKAFGSLLSSSGAASTQFRFTGQQRDPETEFYYLRARYYDPVTGRFMTPDPVRGCATGPDGNPYIYAMNQPTGLTDPSGEAPEPPPGDPSILTSCMLKCLIEAPSVEEWILRGVGSALVLGGQKWVPTRGKLGGAERGTSALRWLADKYPMYIKHKIPTPTGYIGVNFAWKTTGSLTGAVARFAPFVGWGLLAVDSVLYLGCLRQCQIDAGLTVGG